MYCYFSESWKETTARPKPKPTRPSRPKPSKPSRPKPTQTTKRPPTAVVYEGDIKAGAPCQTIGQTFKHKNCQKYYRCVNKKLLVQTCTVGLAWDNDNGRCNWANLNSNCGTRTAGRSFYL